MLEGPYLGAYSSAEVGGSAWTPQKVSTLPSTIGKPRPGPQNHATIPLLKGMSGDQEPIAGNSSVSHQILSLAPQAQKQKKCPWKDGDRILPWLSSKVPIPWKVYLKSL